MKRIIAGLSVVVFTASAQTTAERPRFEAASVQRSAPATNPETVTSGGVLRGERYQLSKATMLDMIRIAYDVDPNIVFAGPDWLEFDRFDIAAKASARTPPSAVRLMLQSLLADRFGPIIHHDMRPMSEGSAYTISAGLEACPSAPGLSQQYCSLSENRVPATSGAAPSHPNKRGSSRVHLKVRRR